VLLKNVAGQGVYLFAYNTSNGQPVPTDQANITGDWSKDGAAPAAFGTTHPTAIGSGHYWQPLSQAESNCNAFAGAWSSTTPNVQIDPVLGFTGTTVLDAKGLDGVATEGTTNARQTLALILDALVAVLSGVPAAGTPGTVTIRDVGNTADRLLIAVDGNGNRTGLTMTPPP
jgi:hypothetical protein